MVLRSNDIVLKMKYPDEFLRTLKDSGVLNIDSATFYELRKDIVTPQPLIDSIFKGNVDTLLSHFFDDNGFIAFELSYDEEKYLIDILYQNKILVNVACESGYLYIDNWSRSIGYSIRLYQVLEFLICKSYISLIFTINN